MSKLTPSLSVCLIVIFIAASLVGCGGGGSSSSSISDNQSVAVVKQTFISDKVIEPTLIIRSHGGKLYAGTEFGLVEINPTTGAKRTVAGNLLTSDFSPSGFTSLIGYPPSILFDNTSAYLPIRDGLDAQISSVSLSQTSTAPDIIVPQRALGVTNFRGIAANTNKTFWLDYDASSSLALYSQDHGIAATNQKLATISGAEGSIVTRGDFVYLYTDLIGAADRKIYKYQISTGNMQLIAQQPRFTSSFILNFPLTASSDGVYWAAGGNIYFQANNSSSSQQVASVAGLVKQLVLSGNDMYVVHADVTSGVPMVGAVIVTRFDTQNWVATEMFQRNPNGTVQFALAGTDAGRTFWAEHQLLGTDTGTQLYEIGATGTLTQLAYPNPSLFYGVTSIYASGSSVAVANGSNILRYSLTSGATDIVRPVVTAYYLQGVGETIFWADANIMRLQLDTPINNPVPLQPGLNLNSAWRQGGVISAGNLYWVGYQNGAGYQISTSSLDGITSATLIQTSSELRDPLVFNNRLYFLCKDDCGAPGWVIASSNLAGSDLQTNATIAGDWPRLYEYSGHYYLTATDGQTSSIFSLDLSNWSYSTVVSQIPYASLFLDFSAKWLYWGGASVNRNGTPSRGISRQAWVNWDQVDGAQQIEAGSGPGVVDDLGVSTIHSFNGNLYYWNHGLIRVPE